MTDKKSVKREFDEFARKVARLESLKRTLDALNTRGFEQDAKIIRAKLKDVNAIPEIERRIRELEKKIETGARGKTISLGKKHAGLEKHYEQTQRKISNLKKLIEAKKKVSCKRQLDKKEVRYVKDIPKLERALKELNKKLDEHLRARRGAVDAGVGVLVDSRFDDFIAGLKVELSAKLKEKERGIDKTMVHDLAEQREMFAEKYKKIVNDFHEKYKQRVQNNLEREVHAHLKEMMEKRLNGEKRKIIAVLMAQDAKRLKAERRAMRRALHKHYNEREKKLAEKINKEIVRLNEEHRAEMRKHYFDYKKKEAELKKRIEKQTTALDADKTHWLARLRGQISRKEKELEDAVNSKRIILAGKIREVSRMRGILAEKHRKFEEIRKSKFVEISKLRKVKEKNIGEARKKRKEVESMKEKAEREIAVKKEQEQKIVRREIGNLRRKEKALGEEMRKLKTQEEEGKGKLRKILKELEAGRDANREQISKEKRELVERVKRMEIETGMKVEEARQKARNDFTNEIKTIRGKMKREYANKASAMNREYQAKVNAELRRRAAVLRKELQAEYNTRLKKELWRRQAELDRRKAEMEQHIIQKAKEFLG